VIIIEIEKKVIDSISDGQTYESQWKTTW